MTIYSDNIKNTHQINEQKRIEHTNYYKIFRKGDFLWNI